MKIEIKESSAARIGLNEDVSAFGLDKDVYLAVIEAELGRGGVVNLNGRVYRNSEFIRENAKLGERVKAQFVEGEAGHPMGGPTFDVPVRLVQVDVDEDGEGSSLASGKFAVLNTQVGRDILTLHRAEMPLGVSSRGYGVVEEHTIDEDSPYLHSNPDKAGETVMEVTDFDLLTYDLVRVPSAGTHVKPATEEAREAYVRVCESGLLGMSHQKKEADVAKKEEVTLHDVDEQIELEAVEESVKEEGEVVEVSPLATLTEKQQGVLIKLASVIEGAEDSEGSDDELLEQVKRVADQADVDRLRLAEAEEVNRSLTEKVAALEAERAEERKALSIRTAIEETFEGKPNAERVKKEVSALVAEGLLDSPEAIDVWGNRLLEMASDIVALNTAVAGAAVVEAVDTSDDLVEVSEEEAAGESAPGLLNEDFAAQLKSIIERDRTLQGRV
tara:strand:- start:2937 stop:4268 length:1332 start_codon:yes stop_codon:yes gene_type:complete